MTRNRGLNGTTEVTREEGRKKVRLKATGIRRRHRILVGVCGDAAPAYEDSSAIAVRKAEAEEKEDG